MQVIVNELATQYQRAGKGKTILFLHGWGDSSKTFAGIIQALGGEYDCVALDLPGFGNTEAPKNVWNLDNYSKFIASFLQKLKIKNVYAVIAHSNGGATAIRAISLEMLNPEKLVLLSASGIRDKGAFRRLALKTVAKTGKALTFWLPFHHRQKLQKKLYGVAGSDMLVTPALKETFKKTVRQDVQSDAKNIGLPTLLIYGLDDRATPPAYGKKFKSIIPDSHLETMEGEHFIHHDQGDMVTKLIKEFL